MKSVFTSRNNLLLISALIALAFSGCKTETTYILTEEELSWMAYDNDQVLKFKSNTGKTLTYSVYGRWRGDGNASVYIGLVGDTTVHTATTGLFLYKDDSGFKVTVEWPHHRSFIPTTMIAHTDTLAGSVLSDVYVSFTSDSTQNIKQVYYSKANGVIKFIDNTDEIFKLIN